MRPNALPTAAAALSLAGIISILTLSVASAQSVGGGCTATVNGASPDTLTRSSPLVVQAHESVSVSGQAPAAIDSAKKITSTTVITLSGIEGVVGFSTEGHHGNGSAWGDSVQVDRYLKYGVGLYRVTAIATGTPAWSCRASGYVKLQGNPLSKPVGRGATAALAVGVATALAATAGKRPAGTTVKRDLAGEVLADAGCALIAFLLFFAFLSFPALLGAAASAGSAKRGTVRTWSRGHTFLGFVGGVIAGLGAAVLAQQYSAWPLTKATALAFPILVGVLAALRARRGRPYKVPA